MQNTTDRLRATLFGPGYPDPNMRVSDADRAEVADRLARHYGDGRLDKAEFDERVSRAMAAKTVGDFQGLFADLPDLPGAPSDTATSTPGAPGTIPPAGYPTRPGRPRGAVRTVLTVALIVIAANITIHAVTFWIAPLMWLVVIAALIMMVSKRGRHIGR